MATAKKKAAPKKKAVVEKKTGEKYASKAMMAKHEKGESKKMRMMEGEIKKFQKGGIKERIQSTTKKGDKWIYVADKSGTVSSIVIPKKGTSSALSIDTTGYSKGKPNYKLETVTKGGGSTTNVKRKDVKKLLTDLKAETKSMQGYKKGGKVSCSCGGKGCMKCGGKTKKYSLGGALGKAKKTSLKTLEKSGSKALVKRTLELPSNATRSNNDFTIKTNEKGRVKTVLNKNKNVSYQAFSDGVVANRVRGDKYTEAMDTTGYSKGKKSFPMTIKKTKTLPGEMEAKKVTRFNVPREKVNSTIQGMKNRVLTAPAKKKTLVKSKPSFGKTLMRKGGKMC